MKKFKVTLSKMFSTSVEIEATTADDARETGMYWLMRGVIDLDGGLIYDGVNIDVEEIKEPSSNTIPVYWEDLTVEKQAEILDAVGDGCNYDTVPIAVIRIKPEVDVDEM